MHGYSPTKWSIVTTAQFSARRIIYLEKGHGQRCKLWRLCFEFSPSPPTTFFSGAITYPTNQPRTQTSPPNRRGPTQERRLTSDALMRSDQNAPSHLRPKPARRTPYPRATVWSGFQMQVICFFLALQATLQSWPGSRLITTRRFTHKWQDKTPVLPNSQTGRGEGCSTLKYVTCTQLLPWRKI